MTDKPASSIRATMKPSGREYEVLPGQSLLEAGLAAGIALPFGCANGSCGDCRARLVQGQVNKIRPHDFVITEAQRLNGHCLLCSTTAVTDVQIDVLIATSVNDIPQQQLQAKLCRVEHIENVSIVWFKFVRGKALRFLPGQRVTVTLANGECIELPIASCPCNAQFVEFHLTADSAQTNEPHQLSKQILSNVPMRTRVTISGPIGDFTLSSAIRKPKLFIAQGNEFAQIQGMVEQVLNNELDTPCCLLWKATDQLSHYRANLCRSWHDAFDHFTFVPVSASHDVLNDIPEQWVAQLSDSEVYLGNKESPLLEQLCELAADSASVFYPN